MASASVDLPQPDGPVRTTNSPGAMSSVMSCRASRCAAAEAVGEVADGDHSGPRRRQTDSTRGDSRRETGGHCTSMRVTWVGDDGAVHIGDGEGDLVAGDAGEDADIVVLQDVVQRQGDGIWLRCGR